MKQRFCRVCKGWHEVEEWPRECYIVQSRAQSDTLAVPFFISDTMAPTEHPLTGTFETSKSKFEQMTRDRGYETVGNDPARLRPRPKPVPDEKGIRDSLDKAKARYDRGERPSDKETSGGIF